MAIRLHFALKPREPDKEPEPVVVEEKPQESQPPSGIPASGLPQGDISPRLSKKGRRVLGPKPKEESNLKTKRRSKKK